MNVADIVRMIFKDYIDGIGCTSIAKKLREMEIPKIRGGNSNSERVVEIKKMKNIQGMLVFNEERNFDKISNKCPLLQRTPPEKTGSVLNFVHIGKICSAKHSLIKCGIYVFANQKPSRHPQV